MRAGNPDRFYEEQSEIAMVPQHSRGGFVLSFEVKLDLNIVGVAKENLPTGAVGHLIHAVGHAPVGKVPLHRLEAMAGERDMINDAESGRCCLPV